MVFRLRLGILVLLSSATVAAGTLSQSHQFISEVGELVASRESTAGAFAIFKYQGIVVRGDVPRSHFMRSLELVEKELGDLEFVYEMRNLIADPFAEPPSELRGAYIVVYSYNLGPNDQCATGRWWWFTGEQVRGEVAE